MCKHHFKRFNDVRVCLKCGLTLTDDGKALFDRRLLPFTQAKKIREMRGK